MGGVLAELSLLGVMGTGWLLVFVVGVRGRLAELLLLLLGALCDVTGRPVELLLCTLSDAVVALLPRRVCRPFSRSLVGNGRGTHSISYVP